MAASVSLQFPAHSKSIMPQTRETREQGSTVQVDFEARAGSKNEAKGRLLRTEVRPLIVEDEPCVLGGGDFSTFRRRFIWQVHSSKFVDKAIPEVESSEEYVEKRRKEIDAYKRHAGHSLTVETKDGYGLIVFMKRGMYDTVPREMESELRDRSENAFRNLVKVYPPPVPTPKDRRHMQALKDELASWGDRGLAWGRTVIFHFYTCSSSLTIESISCTGMRAATPMPHQMYLPRLAPRMK